MISCPNNNCYYPEVNNYSQVPVAFSGTPKTCSTTNIPQQRESSIKTATFLKWCLGLAVAATGIYLAVRKGRTGQIKPLAENIKFKPAKTIEEARSFAFEKFGIKKFNVSDIKMANYVNEGLTNASNISKGKIVLPNSVIATASGKEAQSITWGKGKGSGILTLNPKMYLNSSAKTSDKFHNLYHELGHLNHYYQNPDLIEKFKVNRFDKIELLDKKSSANMMRHLDLMNKKGITKYVRENISKYAIMAPNEFVAESYGLMMSGKKLPKPVLDLYYMYGGPKIGII